jgi:hypothetical protein
MSELKVNKVTPRSGTTVTLGDSGDNVAIPSGVGFNGFGYRNIVINGDMSIAQRGTVTGINTNSYTLDGWITEGDDATLTVSQDTSVPSAQGFGKSLKIAVTTANASVAADEEQKIGQRIEGQFLQQLLYGTASAKSFTLSFWVKSNITGTYGMQFQNDDNNKVQTATYSISSADTWEKKTITISGDTASGFDNDANRSFRVLWWLAAGSNYTSNSASSGAWIARSSNIDSIAYGHAVNVTSSISNTFYITGVQLEAGTTASDFEFLPYDVNLQRCQRYCLKYGGTNIFDPLAIGIAASSTELYTFLDFRTQMRATPSVTSSTLQTNDFSSQQAVTALVTIANQTNNSMGYVKATVASGLTQFRPHFLQSANSTSAYLIFSAEL